MATAAEVEFWKDMCRREKARNDRVRNERYEAIRQQLIADDARKTAQAIADGLEWQVQDLMAENAELRELVRDFNKCLTEAVRLAYIQGHATIYDGTLLGSLHPRMRELRMEVDDGQLHDVSAQ